MRGGEVVQQYRSQLGGGTRDEPHPQRDQPVVAIGVRGGVLSLARLREGSAGGLEPDAPGRRASHLAPVEMDLNYALEPDELAAGVVLTCQSHPTSDQVRIEFL